MSELHCRLCGQRIGHRVAWTDVGWTIMLGADHWYRADDVWRKGRRKRSHDATYRTPPPAERNPWDLVSIVDDRELMDGWHWRIWTDAQIECDACKTPDTHSPR